MEDSSAKKYYKKINTTFTGVNKTDEFAKMFLNLLKSGNTALYQKERRERRIFDDAWMLAMEEAVPVLDKLTRTPRENLKQETEVVPVELAKKIGKDSVRHLASNTQNIRQVDTDGSVKPTKILTTFYESDLGTYENRFLKTLIDKLNVFIQKRYDLLVKKMHTEYINFVNIKSDTNWNDATIDFDITLKINQNLGEDDVDKKNKELFERMQALKTNITNIKMSNFMIAMKTFHPVSPPIQKTNIITKNADYRLCYALWTSLDSIDQIGFDVEVYERDVKFSDEYIEDIMNSLMVLFATIAENQKDEFTLSDENPYEFRQEKKPKFASKYAPDVQLESGYVQLENNSINQYFLDQIKRANFTRFKSLKEAGLSNQESIEIIFAQLNNITNAVYEDYIKSTFDTSEQEMTLQEKIDAQEEILKVYKMVEQLKKDDMKQISTNKAIALLEIRNLKDDLREKLAAEKAEADRIKAERDAELENERIAKELAEIEKLTKIQQAHQVLESAARRRYEKQAKETAMAKEKALEAKQKLKEKMAEQKAKEKAQQKLKEAREKERALERDRLEKQRIRQIELRQAKLAQEQERMRQLSNPNYINPAQIVVKPTTAPKVEATPKKTEPKPKKTEQPKE